MFTKKLLHKQTPPNLSSEDVEAMWFPPSALDVKVNDTVFFAIVSSHMVFIHSIARTHFFPIPSLLHAPNQHKRDSCLAFIHPRAPSSLVRALAPSTFKHKQTLTRRFDKAHPLKIKHPGTCTKTNKQTKTCRVLPKQERLRRRSNEIPLVSENTSSKPCHLRHSKRSATAQRCWWILYLRFRLHMFFYKHEHYMILLLYHFPITSRLMIRSCFCSAVWKSLENSQILSKVSSEGFWSDAFSGLRCFTSSLWGRPKTARGFPHWRRDWRNSWISKEGNLWETMKSGQKLLHGNEGSFNRTAFNIFNAFTDLYWSLLSLVQFLVQFLKLHQEKMHQTVRILQLHRQHLYSTWCSGNFIGCAVTAFTYLAMCILCVCEIRQLVDLSSELSVVILFSSTCPETQVFSLLDDLIQKKDRGMKEQLSWQAEGDVHCNNSK